MKSPHEKALKGSFPGWRTMSSASRHNAKMHHIFENAKVLNAKHDAGRAKHAEQKHKGEYSSCTNCHND